MVALAMDTSVAGSTMSPREKGHGHTASAGSISGAVAGTSEDGGCRKERELRPALSTTDGKDTVAGRG